MPFFRNKSNNNSTFLILLTKNEINYHSTEQIENNLELRSEFELKYFPRLDSFFELLKEKNTGVLMSEYKN